MPSQPTPAIEALAVYGLAHDTFRRDAEQVGAFRDVIATQYPSAANLSEEDLTFCEGWLNLAQLLFTAPDDLDHHIVTSVQASLYAAQGTTRSG